MVDIRKNITRLRQIKQTEEVKALKIAIDMTAKSFTKVKRNLAKYRTENQIVADLTRDFIRFGADGHAYSPIVAAGKNATTIHYVKNNSVINDSDLVLLDVGAEYSNYSADISRTYSVEYPTKRQLEVYNSVKHVQNEAMNLLKPGADMRKYEKRVDEIMAVELVKLGLIDDVKNRKKLKKYYPHLTSHFLGLDTHDSADYEMPIKPGMVLTVEPGIYIPEEGIGIRIEDDVLVTNNGLDVLSSSLPAELY